MDIFLALAGGVTLLLSWLSLLNCSSKDDFSWGLCSLFLPPLSYGYALFRLDVAKDAVALAAIGCTLIGLSFL